MKQFNFRKRTRRNNFTKIFGDIDRRRTLIFKPQRKSHSGFIWRYWHISLSGRGHRSKMKMYRRAAQGWRNKTFGRLQALKIRLQYNRRTPVRRFIK